MKQPDDPHEIAYDRAIECLEEKIQKDKERTLQNFVYKEKDGVIMKSRRSNVIKRNRKTIKLPKGTDGKNMPYDDIVALIESETATKKKTKKKTTKKKPTKKKTTAKKTTKKKPTAKK